MTLGVIGSGHQGSAVARLAIAADYDVVLSNSRGPDTLAALIEELGPHATAATTADAAASGDLVIVAIPVKAFRDLPVAALEKKVVLDASNYYPDRDGPISELDSKTTTTSAFLQGLLPSSRVIKAFSAIYYKTLPVLSRATGASDRAALLIAGDDAAARRTAEEFLDALGYDTLHAGSLAESWRFERDTPAYGLPYAIDGNPENMRRPTPDELTALLARAIR